MNSFTFSSIEVRDIVVSVLVLSMIFAYPQFMGDPSVLAIYLLVVSVVFMGHELSHKFTAVKLGYFSEYRMWPQGLLLALLMALATGGSILFAAPGAVYFASRWVFDTRPSRRDVGLIGASGPAFNIAAGLVAIAGMFFGLAFLYPLALFSTWLAIFNLIPFGPLDGAKVLKWDPKIWGGMLGTAAAMYVTILLV